MTDEHWGPINAHTIGPVWEVFDARTGSTIGYARAWHHEPAIMTVLEAAGIPDREIDASLVPLQALERIPSNLPALCR